MLRIQGKEVPDPSKVAEGTEPPPKVAGYEGPKENLHVYILIGQSNMSGRAEYLKEDAGVIDRCWLLNAGNEWQPARVPFNRYSSLIKGKPLDSQNLNPGYGFVRAMLEKDPSINIGIICNARGSTFIRAWKGGYTSKVLERVKVAQETGVVKGILWHQGESDFKNEQYLDGVKEMIAKYRTELGMPELPFVAGELLRYERFQLVNDQLARLPAEVPHTGLASTEGLTGNKHVLIRTDNVHFDMESMKTLGQRYAEAMLKLQGKDPDR
jgi:hypothetical protein